MKKHCGVVVYLRYTTPVMDASSSVHTNRAIVVYLKTMTHMCVRACAYTHTQGQEVVAEHALEVASKDGHWVILQVSLHKHHSTKLTLPLVFNVHNFNMFVLYNSYF